MKSFKIYLLIVLFLGNVNHAFADDNTTVGLFKSYVTFHSIGIEWAIEGDDNHNATCKVRYKKEGEESWKEGLPLYRVDYTPVAPKPTDDGDTEHFNGLSGSILFLTPARSYQVELTLIDPDDGNYTRIETMTTKTMPLKPYLARTFHVVPGSGDGNGTIEAPFEGIESAQKVAQAGDTFLLHTGHYRGFGEHYKVEFLKSGQEDNYILWQAAGDGEVTMDSIFVKADYIWLEGIHFLAQENATEEYGLVSFDGTKDVVIKHNTFTGFHYSIAIKKGGDGWLISDNVIVGNKDINVTDKGTESWAGEGIELIYTANHTIAHNHISLVADGISSPLKNVDIFGNDIYDVTDDGIEPDNGYANIRIWGNRLSNVRHHALSFQPMNGAPWYFIRNQVAAPTVGVIKSTSTSRALLAQNTFITYGHGFNLASLTFEMKNNLWIALGDTSDMLWKTADIPPFSWRASIGYNGIDQGSRVSPYQWDGISYATLVDFQTETGLEEHSIAIDKESCFEEFNVSAPAPTSILPQYMTLTPSCEAIDAGEVLPNINDDFTGEAPDIGAYEKGQELPHYGVRPKDPDYLIFSDITATAVTLRWGNTQEEKSGFKIYRNDILIHISDENTTTYIDAGLSPTMSYHYTVKTSK